MQRAGTWQRKYATITVGDAHPWPGPEVEHSQCKEKLGRSRNQEPGRVRCWSAERRTEWTSRETKRGKERRRERMTNALSVL